MQIYNLNKVPDEWTETKNTTTQPNGFKWFSNNKSRFSNKRKIALIKIKEDL